MKIVVTEEDIELGVPYDSLQCPLARAISRSVGNTWLVGHSYCALAGVTDDPKQITLPPEAAKFRQAFDDNEPVEPFTFELAL